MADKIYVDVPLSFLEYKVIYREPIFEAWDRPGKLSSSLFRAFRPWQIGLENISRKSNPSDASEIQMSVSLLSGNLNFSVGLGTAILSVNKPDWNQLDIVREIAMAGIEAIRSSANAEIEKQLLTLALHLTPRGTAISSITSKLVQPNLPFAIDGATQAYGIAVYQDNRSWIVDTSGLYPESLFIRLNRTFEPDKALEEIAEDLKQDELQILNFLGLEIQ